MTICCLASWPCLRWPVLTPNPEHLSAGALITKLTALGYTAAGSLCHRFVSVLSGNHALCPRQKGGPRDRQPTLFGRRYRWSPTEHGFGTKLCKCQRLFERPFGGADLLVQFVRTLPTYSAPDHQARWRMSLSGARLPLGIQIRQIGRRNLRDLLLLFLQHILCSCVSFFSHAFVLSLLFFCHLTAHRHSRQHRRDQVRL